MGNNEYYESVLKVITTLDNCELRALRLNGEKWYENWGYTEKDLKNPEES